MTILQAHQGGIASAHACFERLTGKRYMLHTARMFAWEKFLVRRKFTEDDVRIVVNYMKGEIAAHRAFPPQIWFHHLIEDPDRFEEYLNDAQAKSRNAIAPITDRDSVLAATGRSLERQPARVIAMTERVKWHLDNMRKAVRRHGNDARTT